MPRSLRFFTFVVCACALFSALRVEAKNIVPTIPEGETPYPDYVVSVDGEEAPVWRCRVSAIPFNRVWPGYQRSIDQSELAGFATWETDAESNEIVVKCNRADVVDFDSVVIRPASLGITPTVDKAKKEIAFTAPGGASIVVEINGFHNALHLLPFPLYERPANLDAPNLRYFGPGVHNVGAINVESGDEIFVDAGAVVYGGIHGNGVENVKISGPGILDGAPFERGKLGGIFNFNECENVSIDGIVQRDTDVWATTLRHCKNVYIANTKLIGFWRYNADGIDVCNSEDVLVENSFLRTFDDALVVKGLGRSTQPVKDLVFRKNTIWCDWGRAMELGAETSAPEFTNICFEDSDIIRNTHIAMDIQHGDRAKISNVTFQNIRVEFDDKIPTPVYQHSDEQIYDPDADPNFCPSLAVIVIRRTGYSSDDENGTVRNVLFKDIKIFGTRLPPISLDGLNAECDVQGVTFENITIGERSVHPEKDFPFHANEFVGDVKFIP
ncbi:MAG: glycosyl hydrolase family 28 protein [Thermoguttaceae bacterium]